MRAFHANWAYLVVALNLIVGLWGLIFVRRSDTVPRPFWYLIGAGQIALAIQVGLGLAMTETYGRPAQHMFYGFVLLFAAALTYAFRGEGAKRAVTVFASAALFIGVVGIRTMTTG